MVRLSLCLSAGHIREPCKTAEPIETSFEGGQTRVGPRNRVLDEGTRWRHLPNTINRVVRRAAATIAAPNCLLLLLMSVTSQHSMTIFIPLPPVLCPPEACVMFQTCPPVCACVPTGVTGGSILRPACLEF